MYISKEGYMETFVVNETSEDVWFDNMRVMSMSSPIAQETHGVYPESKAIRESMGTGTDRDRISVSAD